MENVYQKIGKLLKEWRESQGFSLYKIAKEGSGKARYDYLKRLENGEGVNAITMTCYLDFCYEHGFNVLEKLYNQNQLQPLTEAEKTTEKIVIEALIEEDKPALEEPTESENEASEEEYGEPSESEQAEWDYGNAQMKYNRGDLLDEEDQIAFIRHRVCPRCGSELIEKSGQYGPYIGCVKFHDRVNKCNYTASGTFESFTVSNKFKNGVTPTPPKEEVADSSSMEE